MNILIVGDNSLMRAVIRETVNEFAVVVAKGDDGDKAFSPYAKHRPDWILMDWEMPKMNGITATRKIIGASPSA